MYTVSQRVRSAYASKAEKEGLRRNVKEMLIKLERQDHSELPDFIRLLADAFKKGVHSQLTSEGA